MSIDWQTRSRDKLKSADKALEVLKPGHRVFITEDRRQNTGILCPVSCILRFTDAVS